MKQRVLVKRFTPDAVIPVYAKPGDAGFDFVAAEDVFIEPGETAMVRTALAFALPKGFEIQVRPRSGLSSKTKLRVANAPGTVDSGYRGEVKILMENTAVGVYDPHQSFHALGTDGQPTEYVCGVSASYLIRKGDRIAQGVLAEVPVAMFEEVDALDQTERGEGGFGSSGTGV